MFNDLMKLATGRVDYFLGQSCAYTHVSDGSVSEFKGIFDSSREVFETEYELSSGISERMSVSSESFSIPPAQGDQLEIGGNTYRVYDFDDHGVSYTLYLKRT